MKKYLAIVFFISSLLGFSQKTVTGKVSSPDMPEGIPGVSIVIKDGNKGTTTDIDGNYSIEVTSDNATIVFSYVGYKSAEIQVGNKTVIDVTLDVDVSKLDEVIVVGYGQQSK